MRTKTKLSMLTLLLTFMVQGLWADEVTPEQARQTASQFLQRKMAKNQSARRSAPAQNELTTGVVFDAVSPAGQPYLYVVSDARQGGYVLVSGDDRFAAVLGYSDDALFDEASLPANMRAWLQGYIDEMRHLLDMGYQPAPPSASLRAMPQRAAAVINPLVTTLWDQGEPYNNLCPIDNNSRRSVTGCVATAMAQLINYHMQTRSAPTAIVADIVGYTTKSHKLNVGAISAGTALPNPDLLLNEYGSGASDDQRTAVAQLMLYCGASVQMDYTSGSSEASSVFVPTALIKNFGFDTTTRLVNRSDYFYSDWIDLICSELAAVRPVFYSGNSSGGGHAFIIDGYDGDALFHVNWGWGGHANDYFALSVLNPDDSNQIGASSSSDGYSINQDAVIGIQIGSDSNPESPLYLTTSNFQVEGQDISFSAFNYTGETHSFVIGIAFIDENMELTQEDDFYLTDDLDNVYGYSKISFTISKDGAYANTTKRIVPVSREANTSDWLTGANPNIYYFEAVYDANGVPQLTAHPLVDLHGGEIIVGPTPYINESKSVRLDVTNNGDEFYGQLYFFASTTETKGTAVASLGLTAEENSTQTISFEWTPTTAGTYNLWVATDSDGSNVIASATAVEITTDSSTEGKTLAITAFAFNNQDDDTYHVDTSTGIRSIVVYGNQLTGTVTVKNLTDEAVSYNLQLKVEKYNENTPQYDNDNNNNYYSGVSINAGETVNLLIDRTLDADSQYRICLVKLTINNNHITDTENLDNRYVVYLKKRTETVYGGITITEDQNGKIATIDASSVETVEILNDIEVDAVTYNRTFSVGKPATIMLPFSIIGGNIKGGTFYTFGGVHKVSDKWEATMNEVTGSLTANTPYLVMPSETSIRFVGGATLNTTGGGGQQTAAEGSHWTFKGTYSYKEWITDGANSAEIGKAYGFAGVQKEGIEVGDFVKVASGAKIRPMGCYLLWSDTPNAAPTHSMNRSAAATEELPSRITVRLVGANGAVTGIGTLDTKTGEVTFDSDGWYDMQGHKLSGKPTKKGLYINNGIKVVVP